MRRAKSHIIVVHSEQSDVGEEEGLGLANPPDIDPGSEFDPTPGPGTGLFV